MLFGNPGSLHRLGQCAELSFTEAMNEVSGILRVLPDELIVTSGGTESINTAILGYTAANPRNGKHIISTKTEHMATLATLERLEKLGFEITYIPVNRLGEPDIEVLEKSIREDTTLITMTHTNNETGAILLADRISGVRKHTNPQTAIHLDLVQTLGKAPIDFRGWGIDLASFSGHKIHCVKGIGLLYVRKGIRILPLISGGGQQRGLRSGTESPWLLRAFSLSLRKAYEEMNEAMPRIAAYKRLLCDKITSLGGVILSPDSASPYIVNAALGSFESETLLHALEAHEIYISTVSACTSKKKKRSHVLSAMGIEDKKSGNAVRFSFSRFTTFGEIEQLCAALDRITDQYALK